MVEGIIARIRAELGERRARGRHGRPGGDAGRRRSRRSRPSIPVLTLTGLRLIWERNRPADAGEAAPSPESQPTSVPSGRLLPDGRGVLRLAPRRSALPLERRLAADPQAGAWRAFRCASCCAGSATRSTPTRIPGAASARWAACRYCAAEVDAAAERWQRALALDGEEGVGAAACLERFAAALGAAAETAGGAAEVARRLAAELRERAARGEEAVRDLEPWLKEREAALLAALRRQLGEEALARIDHDIEADLARYVARMPRARADPGARRRLRAARAGGATRCRVSASSTSESGGHARPGPPAQRRASRRHSGTRHREGRVPRPGPGAARGPGGASCHAVLPGDRVRVRVESVARGFLRGRAEAVLSGAPRRRASPCPLLRPLRRLRVSGARLRRAAAAEGRRCCASRWLARACPGRPPFR